VVDVGVSADGPKSGRRDLFVISEELYKQIFIGEFAFMSDLLDGFVCGQEPVFDQFDSLFCDVFF